MRKPGDESGPGNDVCISSGVAGGGEQEEASGDVAAMGVGVEEVVEEEREVNEAGCDEVGVDFGDMSEVLGLGGGVEEVVEMGWSENWWDLGVV